MKRKSAGKKNSGCIRSIQTAVLLLLLLLAAGCRAEPKEPEIWVQEAPGKDDTGAEAGQEAEKEEEIPAPDQEGLQPAAEEDEAKRTAREERAFITDYISAPLLETTPIRYLSMEIGGTAEEVRFNWMSPGSRPGAVEWKNAGTGETTLFPAQCEAASCENGYYVNKAEVTGIEPGTSYTYRVGSDEGGWSPEYEYKTPEDTGDGFTFLVVTDAQIGQSQNERMARTVDRWNKVLNRLTNYVPEAQFMLHVGDQVANYGSAKQYHGFMDHLPLYRIPLAPVTGNHDVPNESTLETMGDPPLPYFYEHFNVPNRSETCGLSQYDKDGCYYFLRGDALFVVLNSGTNQPVENFEDYVAEVVGLHPDTKWRILIEHYPAYSSVEKYQARLENDKECLARIADDNFIDLVLTGHDHAYTRSMFTDRHSVPYEEYDYASGATAVNPKGTMHVTCSTASGCLYQELAPNEYAAVQGQPHVPMALKIDVTENEIHIMAYLVETWTVYDEYTIYKDL